MFVASENCYGEDICKPIVVDSARFNWSHCFHFFHIKILVSYFVGLDLFFFSIRKLVCLFDWHKKKLLEKFYCVFVIEVHPNKIVLELLPITVSVKLLYELNG